MVRLSLLSALPAHVLILFLLCAAAATTSAQQIVMLSYLDESSVTGSQTTTTAVAVNGTSIRTDGKFVPPELPLMFIPDQFVVINTNDLEAVRPVLEAWITSSCPTCKATWGFAVPGLPEVVDLPCEVLKPRYCMLNRCALYGNLGCHGRYRCDLFNTQKSCERTGFCFWSLLANECKLIN